MSQSATSPYFDRLRLQALQGMLVLRLEDLLEKLGVSLRRNHRYYYGSCCVHGGDNPQALNLYPAGDSVPGIWQCHTRRCEKTFQKTIIGLVRGVLSHKRHDWTHPKCKSVAFKEAVDWCCDFIGQRIDKIKVDSVEAEKQGFAQTIGVLTRGRVIGQAAFDRAALLSRLEIPSPYFLGRGFSKEVLRKYDVGDCLDRTKPFYRRALVPIYDDTGAVCVGVTARSTMPQCPSCKFYHGPQACPRETESARFTKWRHSAGFARDAHLYNWWVARKAITKGSPVFLCESPGDVWRLYESGIESGVGMFGVSLTEQQQILLEMSGATTVVILTNMDHAGRKAALDLKKVLRRSYRVATPEFDKKDLAELTTNEVRRLLGNF